MATMYIYNIPTDETVNLRKTASSSGTILVRVPYGKTVQASYYNSTWHSATYNGYSGYIMSKFLSETDPNGGNGNTGTGTGTPTAGVVQGTRVRVRKEPNTTSEILAQVNTGDKVTYYAGEHYSGSGYTWYRCTSKEWNGNGYIAINYVVKDTDTSGDGNYTIAATVDTVKHGVGGTVKLRVAASQSSDTVTNIPDRATVYVKSMSGEWLAAKYNSYTGYMMAKFVEGSDVYNGSTGSGGGTGVNTATWEQVKNGNGVYKKESSGTAVCDGVKTLQQYLKNIGYGRNNCGNIVVDGNFGSVTETAVKYFQTECELTSDGIVGSATATKLEQAQNDSYFTNSNYYPLNLSLFTYDSYPYNEISLVARIICAEHGYVGTGHSDGRVGVAKVLKNRKDKGGVKLYDNSKPRDFKNVIFGENQYTTAKSAMAYRVKRGSKAFSEAVTYATAICNGNTPSGASLVTNQLFQKGYSADNATYQAKPGYCRYPASGSQYSFFYN